METLKTNEIRQHLHRAETYLNAYLNERPKAKAQITRLHLLVIHYEELLRSRGMMQESDYRAAA